LGGKETSFYYLRWVSLVKIGGIIPKWRFDRFSDFWHYYWEGVPSSGFLGLEGGRKKDLVEEALIRIRKALFTRLEIVGVVGKLSGSWPKLGKGAKGNWPRKKVNPYFHFMARIGG